METKEIKSETKEDLYRLFVIGDLDYFCDSFFNELNEGKNKTDENLDLDYWRFLDIIVKKTYDDIYQCVEINKLDRQIKMKEKHTFSLYDLSNYIENGFYSEISYLTLIIPISSVEEISKKLNELKMFKEKEKKYLMATYNNIVNNGSSKGINAYELILRDFDELHEQKEKFTIKKLLLPYFVKMI
jgi:hypothetical protein